MTNGYLLTTQTFSRKEHLVTNGHSVTNAGLSYGKTCIYDRLVLVISKSNCTFETNKACIIVYSREQTVGNINFNSIWLI